MTTTTMTFELQFCTDCGCYVQVTVDGDEGGLYVHCNDCGSCVGTIDEYGQIER